MSLVIRPRPLVFEEFLSPDGLVAEEIVRFDASEVWERRCFFENGGAETVRLPEDHVSLVEGVAVRVRVGDGVAELGGPEIGGVDGFGGHTDVKVAVGKVAV